MRVEASPVCVQVQREGGVARDDAARLRVHETLLASYEIAPYESLPITGTHVSSLETMAWLRGIPAAPSNHCRTLKMSCANS